MSHSFYIKDVSDLRWDEVSRSIGDPRFSILDDELPGDGSWPWEASHSPCFR